MTTQMRILVLGGNGYVGQNICNAAAASGKFLVQSLSRSGGPSKPAPHLTDLSKVEWLKGDIFDEARREEVFEGVDCIVSTIGAFGSNEFMEKICGDATIQAAETAARQKVSKFGFISSAQVGKLDNMSPRLPMQGYFHGKSRAEDAIQQTFPDSHVILRPGFIYGPRMLGPLGTVPLQLIGAPINFVSTQLGPVSSLIQAIPFTGTECASMVPVNAVAQATVDTLLEEPPTGRVLFAEDIRKFS
eukprot:CAMPEP_0195321788 /NCGR_PEP_ID=MMETSP0708-20121125/6925_1 /TAXON_ID=33640 /ORGANISM="Asterionellopsis glacialis, Strain CCMP134" /LENGTH=244 /DNA_ID=CAMNT_0040388491 /DNA_START=68 /DNA_END=802 /DNA_ORIENTATION=+